MLPFAGVTTSFSTIWTGKSALLNIPAYLSSIPCPWVAKITMRCSSNDWRKASTVRSMSPRIGSMGE